MQESIASLVCDFFNFLATKSVALTEIHESIDQFNKTLAKINPNPSAFTFKIKFYVKSNTRSLVFLIERTEKKIGGLRATSKIIISRYDLPLTIDSQKRVIVSSGMIETFGTIPQRGAWQKTLEDYRDVSERPFSYHYRGWASLLFHISIWATSKLEIRRTVVSIAPETQTLASRYLVELEDAFEFDKSGELTKAMFEPSDDLTNFALEYIMQWLTVQDDQKRLQSFGANSSTLQLKNIK